VNPGCSSDIDSLRATPMNDPNGSYSVRVARADEVPRIAEIENEAGAIFSGLGLIDEALDVSFPLEDLHRLVGMRQVWVACLDEAPVGMVIASVRDGTAYVEEMDVLPAHGRRGLGARLLGSVCDWARARGYAAVTLSTFRDVPWNGPFFWKAGLRGPAPGDLDALDGGNPRERGPARPAGRGAGLHASAAARVARRLNSTGVRNQSPATITTLG